MTLAEVAPALDVCPPTCGTPRTPTRPTVGGRVANVAAMLGTPLDQWQVDVAAVAGETDDAGLPAYRTVVLVVPRQQGKSVLGLATLMERVLRPTPAAVGYTAQTGFDARNKLVDDWWPLIDASPLGDLRVRGRPALRLRKSMGNSGIMVAHGSALRILNATRKAGRGQSLDVAMFDEAFALDRATYGAVSATTITRPHHQLWLVSNAGDDDSVLLADLVGLGRAFVAEDRRDTIALFEWAADRDDDPADPAVWRRVMPAMAAGRVTEATIAARYAEDTSPGRRVFRREYLNVWPTDLADRVLPSGPWAAALDADAAPSAPLVFALETGFDVDAAAVVAADPTGAVEVIDHRPGRGWLVARTAELAARHLPAAVLVDPKGPAGTLIPSLERAGVAVTQLTLEDVVGASARLRDDLLAGVLRVRPHPALDAGAVRRRPLGDRWAIERRGDADVTAIMAAALAHHHAVTAAVPAIY